MPDRFVHITHRVKRAFRTLDSHQGHPSETTLSRPALARAPPIRAAPAARRIPSYSGNRRGIVMPRQGAATSGAAAYHQFGRLDAADARAGSL